MFEFELIYYPTTTTGGPEGLKLPQPDEVQRRGSAQPRRQDKELYRWHWLLKNNRDADDYSGHDQDPRHHGADRCGLQRRGRRV